MNLDDVTAENFFAFITFQSDTTVYEPPKLKIPDGEFLHCAIMLRLINVLMSKQ